ncbi:MerR family transcriptional regulator [Listeria booriae]|uniref:MerR family transcriptional regulator n=1 Tax=Listeria booriae TaxID=1552123 RepID=A0A7X0XGT5_9LIST|nr:MerR family transcriptional regulator [Listeria booriae]MBC1493436.1 MerR family transcriptional regulator [Listeria booriae]MBC1505094.1 MerR family transcriptional regulator [Listeria booriae]MBC1525704.1 MerR family transcriptional regulator [Listeria booriae]MBC1531696.1 MerR family transcriptional regulator [Listeria booriae]
MFKIGEFSKLANVSIRALRHYDKIGLLIPEQINEETNYRNYSAQQLQTINKIQKLKEIGLSLTVIKEILASNAEAATIQSHLAIRELELQEELQKIKQQSQFLENSRLFLKEDSKKLNYHVIQKEIPKRVVASIRDVIPNYSDEGILWEKLYQTLMMNNIAFAKEPYNLAIFHDDSYQESNVDVEVQVAVQTRHPNTELTFKEAPAVQVASVVITGSYEQMTAVTETVAMWLENHHYQLNGPMFNIYHVSIATEPNPQNWVTEACFPIKEQTNEI